MAHVRSACFDGLRNGNESSDDSDVEFVSNNTGKELQFNPVRAEVAQFLCKRLQVQHEEQSIIFTDTGELGAPCKNVSIKGDGNCFFRAVSKAVCGTDYYHGKIRNVTVKQLESNNAKYRSILRSGYSSVSEYISKSKMICPDIWATEVEIQAAADCLGVSIYTYYNDRWIEYSCKDSQVSKQGIYLENRGNHYETVICVKRPQMQSCYGYCKVDTASGNSVTPQPFDASSSNSNDSENDWRTNSDYDHWTCEFDYGYWQEDDEHDHETPGDNSEDTRDHKAETHHQYDSDNSLVDAEVDYEMYDDGDVDNMVCAAEDERLTQERDLNWSLLNRSWHSFLERLGECWWDSVSEEQISSFMNTTKIRAGAIVIAAYFGDMPGGVCSVMVKTENAILTFAVFVRRGRYICNDLIQGEFENPIDIINELARKLGTVYLLPRPREMLHNPKYISVTYIVEEMRDMLEELKGPWWGAPSVKHLELKAVDYLGYLLEIVSAKGLRFMLGFDKFGFTLGTSARHTNIKSVLTYIYTAENVIFVEPK